MTEIELLELILDESVKHTGFLESSIMLMASVSFGVSFLAGLYTFRMLMISKNQSRFW